MSEVRNGPFQCLLAQRHALLNYLQIARQACKKLEESRFNLANSKELEASFATAQRKLDQMQHVLFVGNRATRKTPLIYALLDKPVPTKGHTYDFATEINQFCQLALVDSPGMDAPDGSPQARIAPQVKLRLPSAELVVLTIATPNTNGVGSLIAHYAEHRPSALRARDVCLIWDRSDAEPADTGDTTEIYEIVQRAGIEKVIVVTEKDRPAAVTLLGRTLDERLAKLLMTEFLFPQRERSAAGSSSAFLTTFFTGFLSTAQQKLTEYTPSEQNLDQRIQQLESRIKKIEPAAAESETQLVLLKQKKETLLRYCRDIARFLSTVKSLSSDALLEPCGDGSEGAGAPSLRLYQAAAEEIFDQGWETFSRLVRTSASADVAALDLLEEADRTRYLERVTKNVHAAGNQYLAGWIIGEFTDAPPRQQPPCLHSTLYSLVEESYVWAQRQWQELQLPADRAPSQTSDLHDEIQRALVRLIPHDTNNWNSVSATIWREAILSGMGGGLSIGALALAGVKLAAPTVVIDGGVIAAISGAAAVIVGLVKYVWAKDEQREEIRRKLNELVRDEFSKQLREYKDVGRQQFSLAGTEVYSTFASHVKRSANEYVTSLEEQLTQVDREIRRHDAQIAQAHEARVQISGMRAELHALKQNQAELHALVQKVEAALRSIQIDGEPT